MTDTGYEGGEDTPKPSLHIWSMRLLPFGYGTDKIVAQIVRDETALAIIYLDSMEEYEWLKNRVSGQMRISKNSTSS